MYPRGGGRIEGMDNLDRSMIILMSMVYILARACDVSERCQSHLGRILAGELSEVEKEARSSIFLFQRFLEGEEGLPYAWEVIRLPESNLGEAPIPNVFLAIEQVNGEIYEITNEILRLVSHTGSSQVNPEIMIRSEVSQMHREVNRYLDEIEGIAEEVMGVDFWECGLDFPRQGLVFDLRENFSLPASGGSDLE